MRFSQIAPLWDKRIKEPMDDLMENIYVPTKCVKLDLGNSMYCIVGEAHGFDNHYIIRVDSSYCNICDGLSGDFLRQVRYNGKNSKQFKEVKTQFTKHWNEKHNE